MMPKCTKNIIVVSVGMKNNLLTVALHVYRQD